MKKEMSAKKPSASTIWQQQLREAIHDPLQLLELLNLSNTELAQTVLTKQSFGLCVPRNYVERMRKGDVSDPLLMQVLPRVQEKEQLEGFSLDPVSDQNAEKIPGLLHKYYGRVLLMTTGACAIHCRYCFRQHYDYGSCPPVPNLAALDYIRAESSIHEVILSGGDPLVLLDSRLSELVEELAKIPHVQRLRLHTRLPIILPERVNDTLLSWLTSTRLQAIMVVHANHANEIDEQVKQALQKLVQANVTVLNQSVLLRGINDNVQALINLSESLFNSHVLPYYLHLLDRVQGGAHFEVPEKQAIELLQQIQAKLPGYLVPKLVREVSGMGYKEPLSVHRKLN
jgi:L-lysine 2,3-aminomutase